MSHDWWSDELADILDECLAKGMQMPFVIAAVSPNGSVYATRFSAPGALPETLAEHCEGEGFSLPVNVLVLDQTGQCVVRSTPKERPDALLQ